jgi:7,8-dihydropterin-6-yl-methyl-4-(beta-D-ribofuranosyl)aminobenzene 5'-phosphate synthase
MADLVELDSLSILVIVDNELDPISPSPNPNVLDNGKLKDIGLAGPTRAANHPGGAVKEIRMDHICCSAHGLSLLITGTKDGKEHTILFDTGPEESAFERNAKRLRAEVGKIETIQLSHWHRDHSGGMLKVLSMIHEAKATLPHSYATQAVDVDLHSARPDYRGVQPPGAPVFSLEADPTFNEIEAVGGVVRKNDKAHTVLDDFFLVSGEIPRVTPYEKGLRFGIRYSASTDKWTEDTAIADERFLMCKLKGKGLVMFTGCSHAGVVNASTHAAELGTPTPLYAVMGGYHLADAEKAQIESTAQDLKRLGMKVLMAGHCTGWRAKYEIQKVFGEDSAVLVPSFVGSRFTL